MVFYPYIRHISSHISGIFHESNCFFPSIYGSWGHPQVENGWYHPKPNSVKGPTWKWTGWWFQFQLFSSLKGGVSMFLCSLFSVVSRCSWSETSAYFQVTISLFLFSRFFLRNLPCHQPQATSYVVEDSRSQRSLAGDGGYYSSSAEEGFYTPCWNLLGYLVN